MTQVESYSPRRARRASAEPPPPPSTGRSRRSQQQPAAPPSDDHPGSRRGSHATTVGQGFSWVTVWTILGALLPGSGLIAAGRRNAGTVVLVVLGLAFAAVAAAVALGDPVAWVLSLAVDRQKLMIFVVAVVAAGLVWAGVVIVTNLQLRRYANLTGGQSAFSTLVVCALLAGIAVPTYKVGDYALIQRDLVGAVFKDTTSSSGVAPATKAADPWAHIPRMNVLLIGSDAGDDRTGVRTDSLIMASINTKTGNTVMFSLPRNLGHAMFKPGSPGASRWPNGYWCLNASTGLNDCLINAVWAWGESADGRQYYKGKNPGLQATEDAVSGSLGINVDSYALLDIQGLVQFVDAIGGVRVNVPVALPRGGHPNANPSEGSYYTEATQGYVKAGKNRLLDGYDAMWYARSRRTSSDYARMDRQRCLISAVITQSDPSKLALNFPKIARAIKSNMKTDISQDSLEAWVNLALRIQKAKVTSLTFTDQVLASRDYPSYTLIHGLVKKSIAASNKTPTVATTPTPGSSPSTTTKATTKKKKAVDPTTAQDVNAVC